MDLLEFEASLIYRVGSRTGRATQRKLVLRKNKKQKTNKTKKIHETGGKPQFSLFNFSQSGSVSVYSPTEMSRKLKRGRGKELAS